MIIPRIVVGLGVTTLILLALLQPKPALSRQRTSFDEEMRVFEIQGDGEESPVQGQRVSTRGIVTAVTDAGFFLQDPVGDGVASTSDGIYVYTRSEPGVEVGQCLLVSAAEVKEFYGKTELVAPRDLSTDRQCPAAVLVPAPMPAALPGMDPARLFEPLEGMLVQVERMSGVVQGPTRRYRNGDAEIALMDAQVIPHLPGGRLFQGDEDVSPALLYLSNASGVDLPSVHWGDRVNLHAVTGILDYNFGKYQLLLLGGSVMVEPGAAVPESVPVLEDDAGEFSVCTANLWGMGRGESQHPLPADYELQLRRRARSIAQILNHCTIIALQEAGSPEDVAALAAILRHEHGLPFQDIAVAGPGTLSQAFPLTNGLLTRSDRVQLRMVEQRQGCSESDYQVQDLAAACPSGAFALFNRPPLVVDLEVSGEWDGPYALTVIVNHWKSKGGDESINVVRRDRQAGYVASLVQERIVANSDARVVVLGDLNDFYDSAPVATVRTAPEPDLVHVFDLLPALERYTYIFNGASQVLDHLLLTRNMLPHLGEVKVVHANVDFAVADDLSDVQHASDHDPAYVRIRPDGVAALGGDLDYPGVELNLLDAGGSTVAATLTDDNGEYRLWNLTPGDYRLRVDAPSGVRWQQGDVELSLAAGYQEFEGLDLRHKGLQMVLGSAVQAGHLLSNGRIDQNDN